MQNSNRTWGLVIALIIFSLIALGLMQRSKSSTGVLSANATASSSTTSSGEDGVHMGSVALPSKVPDFHAPIYFSQTIQADAKNALQQAANSLARKLAANSADTKSWIDLGMVRKLAGDYRGAESAWIFVTKISPEDSRAYANLGNLYGTHLKDYRRAEAAYLASIKLNPLDETSYLNLHAIYKDFYKKETSATEDILKRGIAELPHSVNLHVALARYYKEKGDTEKASIQYVAAVAAAKAVGQTAVAEEIKAEENQ